ncbi:MAG: YraN family protein [Usitatibacter sp.]
MTAIAHPTPAQATGGEAEEQAARFLARRGLQLVARNYRTRLGEIDLIAREGATLVFVEVRLRKDSRFGGAVESITARKRRRIAAAARQYLMHMPRVPACRFDVVCIEGDEATWIRGAFAVDSQG